MPIFHLGKTEAHKHTQSREGGWLEDLQCSRLPLYFHFCPLLYFLFKLREQVEEQWLLLRQNLTLTALGRPC